MSYDHRLLYSEKWAVTCVYVEYRGDVKQIC